MLTKFIYSILVIVLTFASLPIAAQSVSTQSTANVCLAAMSHIRPHAQHAHVQAQFAQLSTICLKELYLRCSRIASQGLMGSGEAAWCSFGHEALLKGEFGGDFNALLAWWQVHRDDPVEK